MGRGSAWRRGWAVIRAGVSWRSLAAVALALTLTSLFLANPAWTPKAGAQKVGEITATVSPQVAAAGDTVTYTITVKNLESGNLTIHNLVITLPSGFTYVPGSSGGMATHDPTVSGGGRILTWTGFNREQAPPNMTLVLSFRATVGSAIGTETITVAPITAPQIAALTNAAPVEVVPKADLSLTKTVSAPGTLIAGDAASTATFTLTATNNGPDPAQGVLITDSLPAGLSVVPPLPPGCSGTTEGRCTIGTLPAGGSASFVVTVRADASVLPGVYKNDASVSGDVIDPDPENNTADATFTVQRVADVTLTKAGDTTAVAGQPVTYTLTMQNAGPSDTEVTLTDILPAGLTATSITGAPGCLTATLTCTTILSAGQPPTVVTVIADSSPAIPDGTVLTNRAAVSYSNTGQSETTKTAVLDTTFTAQADLALSKQLVSGSPVVAGSTAVYQLTVTNHGPSVAHGVTINDVLPSGGTLDEPASPGCAAGSPVVCTVGTLQPGVSADIRIAVIVPPGTPATAVLSNSATVTSTTTDPNLANNTASVDTPATREADLQIVKVAPDEPVEAGQPIAYTLTVTNRGPSDATNVQVTDLQPADVTYNGATVSPTGSCQVLTASVSCAVPVLAAGQVATIDITGTVALNVSGPITNTASVTGAETDPDPGNNSSTSISNIFSRTGLSLSKSPSPNPVTAGEALTYTLTATNNGSASVTGAVLTDSIPAGFSVTAASWPGGTCTVTTDITCALGTIAPGGGTVAVTVTGTVLSSVTSGTELINDAAVVDAQGTRVTAASVATVVRSAVISVTKNPPTATAISGTSTTWTIAVHNAGPSDAAGDVEYDMPGPGLTLTRLSGPAGTTCDVTTGRCSIATIPAGDTVVITAAADVAADASGTLTNAATVTGPDIAPPGSSATADVVAGPQPVLRVTKSGPATAVAGGSVSYLIEVTNDGPSVAASTTVTDPLPAGLTFDPSLTSGGCTLGVDGITVTCDLDTLQPGQSKTVQIGATVSPAATGTFTNVSTATAVGAAPVSASAVAAATSESDLSIAKGAVAGVAGNGLTWTLTVLNSGPSPASGATVTDTLPAGVTFVSGQVAGGTCTGSGQAVTCTLPDLAAGASAVITLTTVTSPGLVPPGSTSVEVANSGTVHPGPGTTDPVSGNDTDSGTATITSQAVLAVTKSSHPNPVVAGTELTYTLTIRNAGPSDSHDTELIDTVPPNVEFLPAKSDPRCRITTVVDSGLPAPEDTIACQAGTLGVNEEATFHVVVLVAATLADGSMLGNVAWGSGSGFDPSNDPESGENITDVIARSDLTITKTVSTTHPAPGEWFSYTITVVNHGPSAAHGVIVTDTSSHHHLEGGLHAVPPGADACPVLGVAFRCEVPLLLPGERLAVTVRVRVRPDTLAGTPITDTAQVSATGDDNPDNQASASGKVTLPEVPVTG